MYFTRMQIAILTGKTLWTVDRWHTHGSVPAYVKTIERLWETAPEKVKQELLGSAVYREQPRQINLVNRELIFDLAWNILVATGKPYTRYALAKAVAETGESPVGFQSIYQHYLLAALADPKEDLRKCYDATTNRWQYRRVLHDK